MSSIRRARFLVQLRGDLGEGRAQLRADAVDDADDGNRDAGGDQAILNGGRTRLILRKTLHDVDHSKLHWIHRLSERGSGSRYPRLIRNRDGNLGAARCSEVNIFDESDSCPRKLLRS